MPQHLTTYLLHRQQLKNKAPHGKEEKEKAKKEDKKEMKVFFASQSLQAPSSCENCGKNLAATIKFHPRAHICHIVPKTKQEGGCPSVGTHPQNKWFGCLDCHNFYDQKVAEAEFYEVERMPIVPVLRERFALFFDKIAPLERKNIPAFLLDDKGQPIKPTNPNDTSGKKRGSKGKNK